jgi:hypothetical protein
MACSTAPSVSTIYDFRGNEKKSLKTTILPIFGTFGVIFNIPDFYKPLQFNAL